MPRNTNQVFAYLITKVLCEIFTKADTSRFYEEKAVSLELLYVLISESLFGSHLQGSEKQKNISVQKL